MPIKKEEILDKMKESNVIVLNVLPETDHEKLHIKGSVCFPIIGLRPENFAKAIEVKYGRNNFFITYCSGLPCRHFSEAAEALMRNGMKAEGYAGGIQEWSEAGFPVEGTQS